MRLHDIGRLAVVAMAAVALTAFGTEPASAQDGSRPGMRAGILGFADSLGLSEAQVAEIGAIHEESRARANALREETRARTHAVLTPDQLTRLDALVAARREAMRERRGERRDGGVHRPRDGARRGGRPPAPAPAPAPGT